MRRFVEDAVDYLANLAGAIRRGWSSFFFRPSDPTPLGLIRIAVGVLGFWSLFILGLDLHAYLGPRGWADAERTYRGLQPFAWSFWFFVPESALRLVWLVCLGVFALMAAGLWMLRGRLAQDGEGDIAGLAILVFGGAAAYFALSFLTGAISPAELRASVRRRR